MNIKLKALINVVHRNLQEGSLEVDGGRSIVQRSPGKLRQLNTDTGLFVGKLNIKTVNFFAHMFSLPIISYIN